MVCLCILQVDGYGDPFLLVDFEKIFRGVPQLVIIFLVVFLRAVLNMFGILDLVNFECLIIYI